MVINKISEMRAAAQWGVAAAIAVAVGSTAANMYTAATHVAEGAGGWGELGWEGWLNVTLNAGLALGCEALGFLALAFVIAYCVAKRWANLAAAVAIFVVSLIINGSNTHAFVQKQEQLAALERVRQSEAWQQASLDKRTAEREVSRGTVTISPKALREKLALLTDRREMALQEGRWIEGRQLRNEIKDAEDQLAAAVSLAERASKAQADLDAAVETIGNLEAAAKPSKDAERRAMTIMVSVEVIKALGFLGFSIGEAPRPAPSEKAPAPAPTPPAPTKPRPARAKQQLSIEEKRARQREYTRKWRAAKNLVIA